MQTGWRHDDHGSQREFERLRNTQGVEGTSAPSDGGQGGIQTPIIPSPGPGTPEPAAKRYELYSRLGTVTITSQEGPSYKEWNLERFLTVSVDNLDVFTRVNPLRYDTVKHIDFVAGDNVTIEGSNTVNDRVTITISAAAGGGGYDWDFITDTAVAETITTGEQVSFLGTGIVSVTNVGNVITIHAPATIGWELQAVGTVGTETIDGGDTVVFDKVGDLSVTRVGNTITYGYTNPNPTPYNFNIQANAGATEQIDTGETVTFAEAGGGIAITRTGNTLTFTVTPAAFSFNLEAVGTVGAETIGNGQNIVFDKGGDLVVTRVGDTITYSYTNPNPTVYTFDLKAVGTIGQETIGAGQDIVFDKTGDLTVSRVGDTIIYGYSNPNPTVYSFNIQANTGATTQIDVGETIDFVEAGGGITITRTGNTLTFTVSAAGTYNFLLEAVGTAGSQTINSGDNIVFDKSGDLTVTRVGDTITYGYTNPNPTVYTFLLKAVGTASSETISAGQDIIFDKGGDLVVTRVAETITYSYTNPNPTPYFFNIQANAGATEQIDHAETVTFQEAGGGITITRAGNVLTFTVSTAGTYNWVASDGPNNLTINTTDEVTWVGASGVIVTLNTRTKTFEIDRPLQIQQDGTPVGADDTITLNFDNAVGTKPAGHTGRIWTEVFDVGAGVRRTEMWYDPTGTVYTWNIAASGTSSSSVISNGDTVTFIGAGGVIVTRSGNNITISVDPEDPQYPSDDSTPPLTGFIEFSNTDPDYNGSTPAYMYGTRLYVDVVHNWNLGNMNNVEVHLTDVALDDTPALVHYRDGSVSLAGEDLGDIPFRNFPHWTAIDGNTVRFWATMSLGKPTTMKFYYSMRQI